MNKPAANGVLKYKSKNILERRRRVLQAARELLAAFGYENFNVRDLCARADIAQKTLYNAFQSKDNVIAAAVREFVNEFHEVVELRFEAGTVDGLLEFTIAISASNVMAAGYIQAITNLFYNQVAEDSIREKILAEGKAHYEPFVKAMLESNSLAKDVSPERLSHLLVSTAFSVTSDWCHGDIENDVYPDRAAEVMLIVVSGTTRGKVQQQARRWLEDLRENRASWIAFRNVAGRLGAEAPLAVGSPSATEPASSKPKMATGLQTTTPDGVRQRPSSGGLTSTTTVLRTRRLRSGDRAMSESSD
jgi:AcrR family transcriptional regulator